jgi:hypothetical protein
MWMIIIGAKFCKVIGFPFILLESFTADKDKWLLRQYFIVALFVSVSPDKINSIVRETYFYFLITAVITLLFGGIYLWRGIWSKRNCF